LKRGRNQKRWRRSGERRHSKREKWAAGCRKPLL
jgi:hypothetical protein